MRLLRFMKRGALFIAVSAIIFVAGVSVHLRIEQYRFRRQTERLLQDVRGLELRKASAPEVRSVVKKWGFEEWGRGPGPGSRAPKMSAFIVLNSCRRLIVTFSRILLHRQA